MSFQEKINEIKQRRRDGIEEIKYAKQELSKLLDRLENKPPDLVDLENRWDTEIAIIEKFDIIEKR